MTKRYIVIWSLKDHNAPHFVESEDWNSAYFVFLALRGVMEETVVWFLDTIPSRVDHVKYDDNEVRILAHAHMGQSEYHRD